jgi:hypothetical protein
VRTLTITPWKLVRTIIIIFYTMESCENYNHYTVEACENLGITLYNMESCENYNH